MPVLIFRMGAHQTGGRALLHVGCWGSSDCSGIDNRRLRRRPATLVEHMPVFRIGGFMRDSDTLRNKDLGGL